MIFIAHTFVPSLAAVEHIYDKVRSLNNEVVNEDIDKALRFFAHNEEEAFEFGKKNTIPRLAHFEDFVFTDYIVDNNITLDSENQYREQVVARKTNVVSKTKGGW